MIIRAGTINFLAVPVVEDRAGETHVLAAGVDVVVVNDDGETRLWTVVERR
jgi:hypothetical protein